MCVCVGGGGGGGITHPFLLSTGRRLCGLVALVVRLLNAKFWPY